MEESVGLLWHRLITRAAGRGHPEAAVTLEAVRPVVGMLFRAAGGGGGVAVTAGAARRHGARRRLLERIAGSGERAELASVDAEALRLPPCIDLFPEAALNRDLYLWLAALAAAPGPAAGGEDAWLAANQWRTRWVLGRLPGMRPRYRRLVAAHLARRPDPARLRGAEAARERAVREALERPGTVTAWPAAGPPVHPVPLWLYPAPEGRGDGGQGAEGDGGGGRARSGGRRHAAERVALPQRRGGLLLNRFEVLMTLGEYVRVHREPEEGEADPAAADDLDHLSVARGGRSVASRVRFDLDLPAAEADDRPLGPGIRLPEWDWRRGRLLPERCLVRPMVAARAAPAVLPAHLRRPARRLRRHFEALAPGRLWHRRRPEGQELDLEALLEFSADRLRGRADAERGLHCALDRGGRSLSCLLLADLSLSTDAWIGESGRVIDVIRDSLFLFAEALAATGDRYAIYGFSSRRREHVRMNLIKAFHERYDAAVRGRIAAVRPGYYTRMGAAVRYATRLLAAERAARRLLLLLTDGKPNDLDHYEGRYGIEDTREAVREARRQGLVPFCVTIDEEGAAYLPHLFGSEGFVVVRRPGELPRELPLLYARLTA
ncbi:nitric oxide reductase activation protein NorD [Inmirania thermothiophila]|uniref:Nitric oxide reductase NorD protein n=1 Tax=Inmirania thermothiophila TaxID=1750597 RepID=A0A3N1XS62_9GAMM|nr:VWA domain-containing protein [Inmirania thermothiophila]ROR29494.1 nitric oxide reductase NorD protein [Inmirania thermothiophila]